MRKHHPDILKELERKEKEKKEKAPKQQQYLYKRSETERQLSLTECVGKKMYDVKSEKYKITKKLAISIGSTSVPYNKEQTIPITKTKNNYANYNYN